MLSLKKSVVLLGGEGVAFCHALLVEQGWQVLPVADVSQLATCRQAREASAGVLLLTDRLARNLGKLRKVSAGLDLEWVMLVEREWLGHSGVRDFINDACYDFHCLPLGGERLAMTLGHLHGRTQMRREEKARPHDTVEMGELIGSHALMDKLRRDIKRLARTEVNVLLTGESGTGKELVSQLIHRHSDRGSGPFQAVNCGGLPLQLVQSELFGHERGAFTGASERREGRVAAADGGTLFLDEIGDMPLEAQVNLLRFLQEGTIDRVGSSKPTRVDVRVLSATHITLPVAVAGGRFREDLFYRLNVCQLQLPALRERRSDIPLLVKHLAEQQATRMGLPRKRFSLEALEAMVCHDWPGNVRELINCISHGLVMSSGKVVRVSDLKHAGAHSHGQSPMALESVRSRAEREAIQLACQLHGDNNSQAARMLGVSRATFYRLLQKHQLA